MAPPPGLGRLLGRFGTGSRLQDKGRSQGANPSAPPGVLQTPPNACRPSRNGRTGTLPTTGHRGRDRTFRNMALQLYSSSS